MLCLEIGLDHVKAVSQVFNCFLIFVIVMTIQFSNIGLCSNANKFIGKQTESLMTVTNTYLRHVLVRAIKIIYRCKISPLVLFFCVIMFYYVIIISMHVTSIFQLFFHFLDTTVIYLQYILFYIKVLVSKNQACLMPNSVIL